MKIFIGRIGNKARVTTDIDCLPPDAEEVKTIDGDYSSVVDELLSKGFTVEEA